MWWLRRAVGLQDGNWLSSVTVCRTVSKESENIFPLPQIAVTDWEQGLSLGAVISASTM